MTEACILKHVNVCYWVAVVVNFDLTTCLLVTQDYGRNNNALKAFRMTLLCSL